MQDYKELHFIVTELEEEGVCSRDAIISRLVVAHDLQLSMDLVEVGMFLIVYMGEWHNVSRATKKSIMGKLLNCLCALLFYYVL